MSDADLRTEFEEKARNLEPFKLVEFNRFATGEFVSIVAESAFIGYRMRDEELKKLVPRWVTEREFHAEKGTERMIMRDAGARLLVVFGPFPEYPGSSPPAGRQGGQL